MNAPPRALHLRVLAAALLVSAAEQVEAGGFSALSDLARGSAASKKVKCPTSGAEPSAAPALSAAQALASLEAVLRQGASPEALRALDQAPEAREPGRAFRTGVAALADQRPLAALGLWLRAQRAAPREPAYLVSLAALANQLGRYPEALALVAGAEALRQEPAAPPGFNGRAVLLNNKGQALVGLGRPRQAAPVLAEALRLSPDLAEASVNLAYALGDQGQCDQAVRFLRAGASRQPMFDVVLPPGGKVAPGTAPPTPAPGRSRRAGGGDDLAPLPEWYGVDLARGTPGVLPELDLPTTPVGSTAACQALQASMAAAMGQVAAHTMTSAAAVDAAAARRSAWEREGKRLTARRARYLFQYELHHARLDVSRVPADSLVENLRRTWHDRVEQLDRLVRSTEAFQAEPGQLKPLDEQRRRCNDDRCRDGVDRKIDAVRCASMQRWADGVRPAAVAVEQATRDVYRETHLRSSAAAASFADPAHQRAATSQLALYQASATSELMQQLAKYQCGMSAREPACTPRPARAKPVNPVAAARQELCKKLGGAKATAGVGVLSVGIDCEEVEVGVSTPGWVKLFAQGSYDFDKGQITIFGGAGVEVPGGAFKSEGKAGPYVTFDEHLGIVDFGARTETSHTVGVEAGFIEFGVEQAGWSGQAGAVSSYPGLATY